MNGSPYFNQAVAQREIARLIIERDDQERATKEVLRTFTALIIQLGGIVDIDKAEIRKVSQATLERCPSSRGEGFLCFRAYATETTEQAEAARLELERLAAPRGEPIGVCKVVDVNSPSNGLDPTGVIIDECATVAPAGDQS